MFTTRKGLLAIILIFIVTSGGLKLSSITDFFVKASGPIELPETRRTHILYGDRTGGGHLFGVGKPCKSEFPKDWSSDDIVEIVQGIAANDNLNWKMQKNGYSVVEQTVNSIKVRVVVNKAENEIVTAYPVNVKRNPCPRPANDNNYYN